MDSRKTPLFASATILAGLDVGEVTPAAVQEEQAKAAELEVIYGSSNTMQTTSAFAPPSASPSISMGSQAAAADAMALFSDDGMNNEPDAPLQTEIPHDLMPAEAPQTVVKSGGVQLPDNVAATPPPSASAPQPQESTPDLPAPTPETVGGTRSIPCSACGTTFSVNLPQGISQAVVACPACKMDHVVEA